MLQTLPSRQDWNLAQPPPKSSQNLPYCVLLRMSTTFFHNIQGRGDIKPGEECWLRPRPWLQASPQCASPWDNTIWANRYLVSVERVITVTKHWGDLSSLSLVLSQRSCAASAQRLLLCSGVRSRHCNALVSDCRDNRQVWLNQTAVTI